MLALHLVTVLALTAAVALGIWQYGVWQHRRDDQTTALVDAAPRRLSTVLSADEAFPADAVGRPVGFTGRWLPRSTVYVADRPLHGRRGVWAVTPVAVCPPSDASGCRTASAILVVRGWSPSVRTAPAPPSGAVRVTGWLQPAEGSGVSDPRPDDDVIPEMRVADAIQHVHQDLYGGYVIAQRVTPSTRTHATIERIDLPLGQRSITAVLSENDGSLVSAFADGGDGQLYFATRFAGAGGGGTIGRVSIQPAKPLAGRYGGVLETGGNFTDSGALRIALTPGGQFTGLLTVAGKHFGFRGAIDSQQVAHIRIPRPGQPELALRLAWDGEALGGTLTAGAQTFTLATKRSPWTGEHAAPQASRYTVALDLPYSAPPSEAPPGSGFATMMVSPLGTVSVAGRLADGVPFTAGSIVGADGAFPLIAAAGSGREALAGRVTFRNVAAVSDCDGELAWQRKSRGGAAPYAAGFYHDVRLTGSRFAAPAAGSRVLALDEAGRANIHLSDGGLPQSPLDVPITLTAANRATFPPPLRSMSIDLKTGIFAGTFTHPGDGRVRALRGVFLQKQNRASGFFLGPREGGGVDVTAAQ